MKRITVESKSQHIGIVQFVEIATDRANGKKADIHRPM
jgi:hypothetical protein